MKLNKKLHYEYANEQYTKNNSARKTFKLVCKKFGIKWTENRERVVRKWFKGRNEIDETFEEAKKKKPKKFSKYTLITSCQNATPINKNVWDCILQYKDFLNANLEVIPIRYKNPTSTFHEFKDDWWDKKILPYMIANRHKIHERVSVLGDIKVQLTAQKPLTGFEGLTSKETAIIGHPRLHFKTIPRLKGQHPKFITTTGIISQPNYTDSKAGKKGQFHHSYGFVIVEDLGNDNFNFRQVSCEEDGTFYDLDYKVSKDGVLKGEFVDAVVVGDLHSGEATCQTTLKCSYEMIDRFKPKNTVLHDVMDGYVTNPHELKNPFIQARNEREGKTTISAEIEEVKSTINPMLSYGVVIAKSNHDIFVDRFLMGDWRKGTAKSDYLKYAYLMDSEQLPNGILPYELEQEFGDSVLCLTESESFQVNGVELGQHGHLGVAGSRGSVTQFKRLNTKIITAHTHKPFREDGAMGVGTNTKTYLEYTKGLTEWMQSNCIVHCNGKMQNLLIFNGKYTTL